MTHEFHPWEIWNGGECPCPGEMVQCQKKSENRPQAEQSDVVPARHARWKHEQLLSDIIAFRRVQKPETITGYYRSGWVFGAASAFEDTHRLTFNVDADGNPYNFQCERIA